MTIENDGSGEFSYVVAIDYEAFAALDDSGVAGSRDEFCEEAASDQSDVPEGATVESYDEDGYCGIRVTVEIPANDNFGEALSEAVNQGSSSELQNFEIEKQADDQWTFFLPLEDSELDALEPDTPPQDPAEEAQLQLIKESFEIRYSVEFPGEAGEHNADSATARDGKTLFEWEVDPFGSLEPLTAETVPTDGSSNDAEAPPVVPPADDDETRPEGTTEFAEPENEDATNEDPAGNLPFGADDANPAVTNTGPGTAILLLGMFAILAVLGGIVALVLKWPGRAATAGPRVTSTPDSFMKPAVNPFDKPIQNGPPQNAPPQNGSIPGGPPLSGPPPHNQPFNANPYGGPPQGDPASQTPQPGQNPQPGQAADNPWGGPPPPVT